MTLPAANCFSMPFARMSSATLETTPSTEMLLWDTTKTLLPFDMQSIAISAMVCVLPVPGGPQMTVTGSFSAWAFAASCPVSTSSIGRFVESLGPSWSSLTAMGFFFGLSVKRRSFIESSSFQGSTLMNAEGTFAPRFNARMRMTSKSSHASTLPLALSLPAVTVTGESSERNSSASRSKL